MSPVAMYPIKRLWKMAKLARGRTVHPVSVRRDVPEEPYEMVQPCWPLAVLAVIQLSDAAMCVKPVAFIRQCLVEVRFPERLWKLLPPLKIATATGLVAGIWVPPLALLTCAALICYFVVAIAAHIRARDLGRNLFLNATATLAICTATLVFVVRAA
jgi:hypothetical protein